MSSLNCAPDIIVSSRSTYNCKICGEELHRNRHAIRKHVYAAHNKMTFVSYGTSHEADGTGPCSEDNPCSEVVMEEQQNGGRAA